MASPAWSPEDWASRAGSCRGNRDYDPQTGTFLSPDPVDGDPGTPDEANPYDYVGNDPINYVDPLGLCRTTDVEFKVPYLDDDPIEVLQGTDGGWDYDQCKGAGLCSSELPIVYDDPDTAPPGGYRAPTGEGNTAWCGPAWEGPSPFMEGLSRVRISGDVCPLVGCAGFVFQDGHLTVFGGPGGALSAPSLGASLYDEPLEPGSEDWNRVFGWVAWFGASCTWDGTWSKDPDRSCQPGLSKEWGSPKAGAGFAHEWSFTWELW